MKNKDFLIVINCGYSVKIISNKTKNVPVEFHLQFLLEFRLLDF